MTCLGSLGYVFQFRDLFSKINGHFNRRVSESKVLDRNGGSSLLTP